MSTGAVDPPLTEDADRVVVGRVGRAHGIKGEVSVETRTDEPERRFAAGSTLFTRAPGGAVVPGRLTVGSTRNHQGRLLVRFAEFADRTSAERARGTWLEIDVAPGERPEDPEDFYDHQLIGLAAVDPQGRPIGEVVRIEHNGAQDLLQLRLGDGRVVLFPFVTALVPEVDVDAGRIVVDDIPGLLTAE